MKYFFLLLFLNFQHQVFAQEVTIKGQIKDSLANPLSVVNVQVIEALTNKQIAFVTSNNDGRFEINTQSKNNSKLFLKVTHLGYDNYTEEITPVKKLYSITLKQKNTILNEVKIEANFRDVTEKNDTVSYNLKRLLNGSETKLKDVIKKLPGLSIDDNGKINYNGKKIDDILIEGDELYDKQHQLATENIKAEMIEKIDFLKNRQDFSSIKGFNESNKTALNLTLKEEYKNALKCDLEAQYGYKKRYKQHNNLYNFGSKNKINLITEHNNVNIPVITVTDYLELKKGISSEINQETVGSTFKVEDNLPSFLFSEDDINKKELKFYSLNFQKNSSKKTKIKGFSFLNTIYQNEFLNSIQNFYSSENIPVLKESSIEGKSAFNTNKIEIEHKENDNTYYNYIVITNYNNDFQDKNLLNNVNSQLTYFKESVTNSNFNIGQKLGYKKKISNSVLLNFSLFNDFTISNDYLDLSSGSPFLNLNFQNQFDANQKIKSSNVKLGFNSKLTLKRKIGTFNLKIGSSSEQEKLESFLNDDNPDFNFSSNTLKSNNYIGLNFNNKKKEIFNYSLGFDILNTNLNNNSSQNNFTVFLPTANFTIDVSKKTNFGIGYRRNSTSPTIKQSAKGLIIENYRTVTDNNHIDFKTVLPGNSFSFNGSYANLPLGITSFLSAIYNNNNKAIGINSSNSENQTLKENRLIDLDNSLYLFYTFEKKFSRIPWAIKFLSLQSRFVREDYVNNVSSVFKTNQNKSGIEMISYFKSGAFNINFGAEYIDSHSKNTALNITNDFYKITPYINFNGVCFKNRINWDVNTKYIFYTSASSKRKILDLSPKINLKNNDWNFSITGNNILNIKSSNRKATINYNSTYAEETTFSSLSGYVNLGVGFSF